MSDRHELRLGRRITSAEADSTSVLSVLANAGYRVLTNTEYERLREMASDWVHSRQQYRKCKNCGDYGDEDVDGEFVNPGISEWWCADCVASLTDEEIEEQFGIGHLFRTINKAGGR